ncbi:hypothetical protein [Nocardia sp. NPDC048505]|uniref:hypothetical protein n=1 Tax=unclassified Nocardia TaxID=2637762 RepID=UPI0033E07615
MEHAGLLALGLELASISMAAVQNPCAAFAEELTVAATECARTGVALEELRAAVRDGIRSGLCGRALDSTVLTCLVDTVTELVSGAYRAELRQPAR